MSQKMMAELYGVSVAAINQHIKKILKDNELKEGQTIKKYLIVQDEGGTTVRRNVVHYNLQMIIAVGFKMNNASVAAFRKWANRYAMTVDYDKNTKMTLRLVNVLPAVLYSIMTVVEVDNRIISGYIGEILGGCRLIN